MEETKDGLPLSGAASNAAADENPAGAEPHGGTERRRGAPQRRTPRKKSLRRAVERSLSRRVGAGEARPPADGYGAVADALVRQAVDGDLKAVKLLLEILDGGGKEGDGETVQVIVDV